MNIFKKSLAPITDEGWKELTDQTKKLLKTHLTAREFVDINGPNGMDFGGVSTGRLINSGKNSKEGVNFGIREFLPLTEIRKPFELDLWELDNADRGAKDINLEPLEEAVKAIALFEENAIYKGFKDGQIRGLEESAEHPMVLLPDDPNDVLNIISAQVISLRKEGVEGPYTLVLTDDIWKKLVTLSKGYPVIKQLNEITGGNVIVNNYNENSFLVSEQGEDYELIIGQDISIGYDGHTTEKVKLYLTGSFTFRVLSPEAIRVLTKKK